MVADVTAAADRRPEDFGMRINAMSAKREFTRVMAECRPFLRNT